MAPALTAARCGLVRGKGNATRAPHSALLSRLSRRSAGVCQHNQPDVLLRGGCGAAAGGALPAPSIVVLSDDWCGRIRDSLSRPLPKEKPPAVHLAPPGVRATV